MRSAGTIVSSSEDALGRFLDRELVVHERSATARAGRRAAAAAVGLALAAGLLEAALDLPPAQEHLSSALSGIGHGVATAALVAALAILALALVAWRRRPTASGWRIGLDAVTLAVLVAVPVLEVVPVSVYVAHAPRDQLLGGGLLSVMTAATVAVGLAGRRASRSTRPNPPDRVANVAERSRP